MFRFFLGICPAFIVQTDNSREVDPASSYITILLVFRAKLSSHFVYVLSTNKQLGADWPTQRA